MVDTAAVRYSTCSVLPGTVLFAMRYMEAASNLPCVGKETGMRYNQVRARCKHAQMEPGTAHRAATTAEHAPVVASAL